MGRPAAGQGPAAPPVDGRAAPAAYSLCLLGRPQVWRATGQVAEREVAWRLRRALLVLAFLALAPARRAGKEELVEAIWQEADAEAVRRNFHPTLSWLRRALAQDAAPSARRRAAGVVGRQGTYQLDPAADWRIDVDAFTALADAGRQALAARDAAAAVAAWERARRLYRGPLLEGFDEAWIEAPREALRQRHLELLHRLAESYLELGRVEEAVDAARALLAEDPLQEAVHVTLMRLYARLGRRDLVRRQYERLTGILAGELNVEPLLDTTLEYHRLMGQAGGA